MVQPAAFLGGLVQRLGVPLALLYTPALAMQAVAPLSSRAGLVAAPPQEAHTDFSLASNSRAALVGPQMPEVAWRSLQHLAVGKRQKLVRESQPGATSVNGSNFEAVEVQLPLEPPVLDHDRDADYVEGRKNIVGAAQLTGRGRPCVFYGIGIADDSSFEQQMVDLGCEVHAFDCTVPPDSEAVVNKGFSFHQWCIGQSSNETIMPDQYTGENNDTASSYVFKTLRETMAELNHTYIDVMKFDIEGFEWQLFDTDILNDQNPPEQLLFELHSEGASPLFVPPEIVRGKGYAAVNRLFLDLFDRGYRVTSKEVNNWDPACSEFVAIRLAGLGSSEAA